MGWRLLKWFWGDADPEPVTPDGRVAVLRPRLRVAVLKPMETPLSNIITGYAKGAGARLIFGFDWTAEIAATSPGDAIATSSWAVTGATKDTEPATVGNVTMVQLSGGTPGSVARAVNTIQYTSGQIDTRTLEIWIL